MGKLDNSLKLLQILHENEIVSTEDLAQQLNVTSRQIRTYVTYLKTADIQIDSKSGPHGGFYLSSKVCPICNQKRIVKLISKE